MFEPGILQHNVLLPSHAYVFDANQRAVVVEERGLGSGCLLARSPQTGRLATWCPAKEDWSDVLTYYGAPASYYVVVEEEGFLWTTGTPPERITKQQGPQDLWIWSRDRSRVAYTQYDVDKERTTLFWVDREGNVLGSYEDPSSWYLVLNYMTPWSPDGQYLAFEADCGTRPRCYDILDTGSNEIVYSSADPPEALHQRNLVWSPDGQYIALATDEGLFLVHLDSGRFEKRADFPLGPIRSWQP